MTPSPEPDDSDILARLAQAESRLARLESIQARQPLVPGGYVNEIREQFKKTIDDLLNRRIDQDEEVKRKSRQDEEAKREARHNELMGKLDLGVK
jgi:hypothetical protein